MNLCCGRETLRKTLHRLGFSYKKAKKLLMRACPKQRADYIQRLRGWLDEARQGERTLVFWDPAHVRQDVDLGYGWGPADERLYVASNSPKRGNKVTLFGAYLYNEGQVWLKADKTANSRTVRNALFDLRQHLGDAPKITVVADNANYLKNRINHQFARRHGMEVVHIPAYSPDLMPVEELWNWFRQQVTRNVLFDSTEQIVQAALDFQNTVNADLYNVADRLVVIDELDPAFEKLLAS